MLRMTADDLLIENRRVPVLAGGKDLMAAIPTVKLGL
jgi:hypothetical protein